MSDYTLYNLGYAALAVPACIVFLHRKTGWRGVRLCGRLGVLVTAFGYPWDFFGIHFEAWSYPKDPGPLLYGVPVNDLVFMWLCTFLATSFLMRVGNRRTGGQRHSESEYTSEEDA
jgi:lycopene cyclase domain-containing protein